MTRVAEVMVKYNLVSTKEAYNHYRLLKYLSTLGDLSVSTSRRLGGGARRVRLTAEDFASMGALKIFRNAQSNVRFTSTFSILVRRELLVYKGSGIYEISRELLDALNPTEDDQCEDTSSSESSEGPFLEVTIRLAWNEGLSKFIGAANEYFIGEVPVTEEQYTEFVSNNSNSPGLVDLAKVKKPELPKLWGKVPIVKVEKAE